MQRPPPGSTRTYTFFPYPTLCPSPRRDPPLAGSVDDSRTPPLARRHRREDRFLPADQAVVDIGLFHLALQLADAREQAHDALQPAHAAKLTELDRKSTRLNSSH